MIIGKLLIPKFIRKLVDEEKHLSLPQHNGTSGFLASRELERGNGGRRPTAPTLLIKRLALIFSNLNNRPRGKSPPLRDVVELNFTCRCRRTAGKQRSKR